MLSGMLSFKLFLIPHTKLETVFQNIQSFIVLLNVYIKAGVFLSPKVSSIISVDKLLEFS